MAAIRTDRATRERYSQGGGIYRIVPAAVARPVDVPALVAALDWAAERDLPVTPRGAGTAMDGGNVGSGLVVDLTGLAVRDPVIDVDARTVRADAGVALSRIASAAARHGMRFGPDPSSAAWATVGGAIATNAAGARSHRSGAVDRWVEAVELVTLDGPLSLARGRPADLDHPVVHRFTSEALPVLRAHRPAVLGRVPPTTKNTAGYGLWRYHERGHLLDLVIGSEGTLAVITSATLRLEPLPAERVTIEVRIDTRDAIADVVTALEPASPSAVELFDRSFLAFVAEATGLQDGGAASDDAAVLLVDLEGDDAKDLSARVALVAEIGERHGARVRVARDPEAIAALWSLRHRASPILAGLADGRRSLQVIEDGCVPLAALPAYLDAVDAACRRVAIDAVMFGHAGDGHVHVNLLPDLSRPDWLGAVRTIFDEVTDALWRLRGTPAGEHGAGRLRAGLLERFVGPEAMICARAVKRAFDPTGRLNPGVILPDGADPFTRLKVGVDATPIDPAIAAELQRIEAERRWGESRWGDGEG